MSVLTAANPENRTDPHLMLHMYPGCLYIHVAELENLGQSYVLLDIIIPEGEYISCLVCESEIWDNVHEILYHTPNLVTTPTTSDHTDSNK